MWRRLFTVVAVVVLFGCRGNSPTAQNDPFLFGPQRVPPPGTGAAAPPVGGDPYSPSVPLNACPPSASSAQPSAAQWAAAGSSGTATPQRDESQAKAGAVEARTVGFAAASTGDRVTIPAEARSMDVATRTVPVATVAAAPSTAPAPSAGRDRYVQTLPPRTSGTASTGGTGTSGGTGAASGKVIDIMQLPPVTRPSESRTKQLTGDIRLVSAEEPIRPGGLSWSSSQGGQPKEAKAATVSDSRYGYDPQYAWLRGKLEYSQADHRWKLRYIPVDGNTDDHGGSVVLADSPLLADCKANMFVEVRGKIQAVGTSQRGFAPKYEIASLSVVGK